MICDGRPGGVGSSQELTIQSTTYIAVELNNSAHNTFQYLTITGADTWVVLLGAGSNDNPTIPNLLRILVGEAAACATSDEMWVVETNIDNMSGEVLGYVMDKLFEAGAVDAYFTPIQMKKGRPGTIVSAIVPESRLPAVEMVLLNQTTTFGIRRYKVVRTILEREFKEVDSQFGKIKVKIGKYHGDIKSLSPEYEDCRKIAEERGIPLKQVYSIISKELGANGGTTDS